MLVVTIDGVAASWTMTDGWCCSDALTHQRLRAACEPDTPHRHEATALASVVRHFSSDAVRVRELGNMTAEDPGISVELQSAAFASYDAHLAVRSERIDTFERDVVEAYTSRQETVHLRLVGYLARRLASLSPSLPLLPCSAPTSCAPSTRASS